MSVDAGAKGTNRCGRSLEDNAPGCVADSETQVVESFEITIHGYFGGVWQIPKLVEPDHCGR
jgi:hypothetical protein